jgi:hypothetical protein
MRVLTRGFRPVKDDRSDMVAIAGVGMSFDVDPPPSARSGHHEVIQNGTAAENHFSTGAVGMATDSSVVGKQVQSVVVESPPPWLAVVQRGCATS